jgi:hypothetical protein
MAKAYDNRKKYIQDLARAAGLRTKFDFQQGFILLDGETEVIVKKRVSSLRADLEIFLRAVQAYIKAKSHQSS